jgi:hypothetical protein
VSPRGGDLEGAATDSDSHLVEQFQALESRLRALDASVAAHASMPASAPSDTATASGNVTASGNGTAARSVFPSVAGEQPGSSDAGVSSLPLQSSPMSGRSGPDNASGVRSVIPIGEPGSAVGVASLPVQSSPSTVPPVPGNAAGSGPANIAAGAIPGLSDGAGVGPANSAACWAVPTRAGEATQQGSAGVRALLRRVLLTHVLLVMHVQLCIHVQR